MNLIKELILEYSGQHQTVAFQRPYVDFTGSIEGALLLGQMIYWSNKGNQDGWFYKTYLDWEKEIYVKERTVRSIARTFEAQGFLEILKKRTADGTPKMHYRFSVDAFAITFEKFLKSKNNEDSRSSNSAETIPQDLRSQKKDDFCRNVSAILPDRNGKNDGPDSASLPEHPYIQFTTSNQLLTIQDPERARGNDSVKVASCEIVSEPESLQADRTSYPGPQASLVNPSNLVGDNFSAMGPVTPIDSAAPLVTVERASPSREYKDVGLNGFGGFKVKYEDACELLNCQFGSVELAEESWRVAWRGLEPPEDFWTGLDLYCSQQQKEFLSRGKCWMLGAKRFLDEQKWLSALRIHDRDRRAESIGLDFHNPELMKKAALRESNRRNGELARLQLIEEGFLTA